MHILICFFYYFFVLPIQPVVTFCTQNNLSRAESASHNRHDGKLFGGNFTDGISSAVDAMSMER